MRAWLSVLGLLAIAGCTAEAPDADGDRVVVLLDASVGPPCGDSVCSLGEVCCNPSCGICAKPNGFCTQQLCNVPPPRVAGDGDASGGVEGDAEGMGRG